MEVLKLNIELADNGIIIRNLDCEDEVILALTGGGTHKDEAYGYDIDHTKEYEAIGRKIFDWLKDDVLPEHYADMIVTNFDLEVKCKCKGKALRNASR